MSFLTGYRGAIAEADKNFDPQADIEMLWLSWVLRDKDDEFGIFAKFSYPDEWRAVP